jgi:hypothetical protein
MKKLSLLLFALLLLAISCKKEKINDNSGGNSGGDVITIPLCFTAEEAGATITIWSNGEFDPIPNFQYSYDRNTWHEYVLNTTVVTLEDVGDIVYFRGDNPNGFCSQSSNYDQLDIVFGIIKKVAASGNIMSLIDPTCETKTIPCKGCFNYLFYNSMITTAPLLPATILDDYCYTYMFLNCKELKTAPELPAVSLASYCYSYMFDGCSNLTSTPILPATTLAEGCYKDMFNECFGLTEVPELPATTMAYGCYNEMFRGCINITTVKELPATTLAPFCYEQMFQSTSITEAPDLPATELAEGCYANMFSDCSKLTKAPSLPATTLDKNCYWGMFHLCGNLVDAPDLPATTLAQGCYYAMFENCRNLVNAPDLPATTLVPMCYDGMFAYCTNINNIKVYFSDWNNGNSTDVWFYCASDNGTFRCPASLPQVIGPNNIPEGWTIETF